MTRYRFPRTARLTRAREYRRVFSSPARSADGYFAVLARLNEGGTARLGIAVSKKCAPRAVQRTRLRRLIRETFRHSRQVLGTIDYVVLCRQRAVSSSDATLRASLLDHWAKLHRDLCAKS